MTSKIWVLWQWWCSYMELLFFPFLTIKTIWFLFIISYKLQTTLKELWESYKLFAVKVRVEKLEKLLLLHIVQHIMYNNIFLNNVFVLSLSNIAKYKTAIASEWLFYKCSLASTLLENHWSLIIILHATCIYWLSIRVNGVVCKTMCPLIHISERWWSPRTLLCCLVNLLSCVLPIRVMSSSSSDSWNDLWSTVSWLKWMGRER